MMIVPSSMRISENDAVRRGRVSDQCGVSICPAQFELPSSFRDGNGQRTNETSAISMRPARKEKTAGAHLPLVVSAGVPALSPGSSSSFATRWETAIPRLAAKDGIKAGDGWISVVTASRTASTDIRNGMIRRTPKPASPRTIVAKAGA
jgi:hypothetical protein